MHDSSRRPGRIFVLVLILFATCYFADWTDDYNSYYNATRYTAFQTANGRKAPLSGGGLISTGMMAALTMKQEPAVQQSSALEAVFGSPIGSSQPGNDGARTSLAQTRMGAFSGTGNLSTGGDFGNNRTGFGLSGNSGFGLSGPSSSTGFSNSTGMSTSASSIFGPQ